MRTACPLCDAPNPPGYGEGEQRCACGWDSLWDGLPGMAERIARIRGLRAAIQAVEAAGAQLDAALAAARQDQRGLAHRDRKYAHLSRAHSALSAAERLLAGLEIAELLPSVGAGWRADDDQPARWGVISVAWNWSSKGQVVEALGADLAAVRAAAGALETGLVAEVREATAIAASA